jgi:hypothetical protein
MNVCLIELNFIEFLDVDDSEAMIPIETDCLNADWIQELPEDLDMCIAQRDFEGAVDLVEKGTYHTYHISLCLYHLAKRRMRGGSG